MENQVFTDNIKEVAGPEEWGWIRRFAKKTKITERHARSILKEGVFPNPETLVNIAGAYNTTVDALLTDPQEIKAKAKQSQSPLLDMANDPELAEMMKNPEFKKNYDKTIDILKSIHKLDDDEAAGDMLGALKHVFKIAIKREKKKG